MCSPTLGTEMTTCETHILIDMCSLTIPHISLVICVPFSGKHISLVICVPLPREYISLGICFPGMPCVPLPGKHIALVICFPLPRKHISLVIQCMCSLVGETNFTRDMCLGQHISVISLSYVVSHDTCSPEHISLVTCVSWVGKHTDAMITGDVFPYLQNTYH